jgi:GTP-binding protein
VGLVGLPNSGKSTLLAKLSAARPKIADYPFTTLHPELGVVRLGEFRQCVMADIPGLISGAHLGKGLGIQFLRHIERTRVLLFLLDVTSSDPQRDYQTLCDELALFKADLLEKPSLVVLNKIDVWLPGREYPLIEAHKGSLCHAISALTGQGTEQLRGLITRQLEVAGARKEPR